MLCRRTIVQDSVCDICGNGEEDENHVVISCTKSKALIFAMRKEWRLPEEKEFWYTGTDWLQILLDKYDSEIRKKNLLLLWRAWYLRDDIMHHKGTASVAESVIFLSNYWYCLNGDINSAHDLKGKTPVAAIPRAKSEASAHASNWTRAPVGGMKVNSDASFIATSSWAAAGVIASNSNGAV